MVEKKYVKPKASVKINLILLGADSVLQLNFKK